MNASSDRDARVQVMDALRDQGDLLPDYFVCTGSYA
jgi:hypothetical protein